MIPVVEAILPIRARKVIGQVALSCFAPMYFCFFLFFVFLPIGIFVGVALFAVAGIVGSNFGLNLLTMVRVKIMLNLFAFLRISLAPLSLFFRPALGANSVQSVRFSAVTMEVFSSCRERILTFS